MKRNSLTSLLLLSLLVVAAGCVKRVDKSAKAEEHDRWKASLEDSITALRQEASQSELNLDEATDRVGIMLENFEHVENPREVEGYIILKGWRKLYPLTSTGIVARITEGEGLELVAALSGGFFDRISVDAGGSSVESAVVPHDQALNYRSAGLNTVAFYGPQADSVASFIASHELSPVTINYINGGRISSSKVIPEPARKMIAATWQLYSSRKEVERLERTLPMINRKISAIRAMIDGSSSAPAAAPPATQQDSSTPAQ